MLGKWVAMDLVVLLVVVGQAAALCLVDLDQLVHIHINVEHNVYTLVDFVMDVLVVCNLMVLTVDVVDSVILLDEMLVLYFVPAVKTFLSIVLLMLVAAVEVEVPLLFTLIM